jgi:hypothetical protein
LPALDRQVGDARHPPVPAQDEAVGDLNALQAVVLPQVAREPVHRLGAAPPRAAFRFAVSAGPENRLFAMPIIDPGVEIALHRHQSAAVVGRLGAFDGVAELPPQPL